MTSFSCEATVNFNKALRQKTVFVTQETGFLSLLIRPEWCLHKGQRLPKSSPVWVIHGSAAGHLLETSQDPAESTERINRPLGAL